jgi:hypothetical protein
MMKNTLASGILFLVAATGVLGCGPAAPTTPTWEHDIHPLLVARCIRCHDGGGHSDPLTSTTVQTLTPALASFNFNYGVLPNPVPPGIQLLHSKTGVDILRGPMGLFPIMPPPPAERLEDWQIEMVANWAAQPDIR